MGKRSASSQTFDWADRDYIIYALALGLGSEFLPESTLDFVYERCLKVVPTFPTTLAWLVEPTFASLGAKPEFALHSGQKIEIHRLPTGPTTVQVGSRVVALQDKGRERGAIIVTRQEVRRMPDGASLATLTTTCFARDAGGCGNLGEPSSAPHPIPARKPDHIVRYSIRRDAALLYRLTGDRNPLHSDPEAARAAGFERPILHGLCTFGMTCRALLERIAEGQPESIASQEARFSAPVYPGDTLEVGLWRDGPVVSIEATVPERGAKVLTNGKAVLRR